MYCTSEYIAVKLLYTRIWNFTNPAFQLNISSKKMNNFLSCLIIVHVSHFTSFTVHIFHEFHLNVFRQFLCACCKRVLMILGRWVEEGPIRCWWVQGGSVHRIQPRDIRWHRISRTYASSQLSYTPPLWLRSPIGYLSILMCSSVVLHDDICMIYWCGSS